MGRPLVIILLLAAAAFAVPELVAQELISQERYPNGSLRSTRYSEGRRVHFITYHENGQVKEMGCFDNGRRDGVWKQYSDTGALLAQAGFSNGQRQGVWEFRNADDQPVGRLTYTNGSLTRGEAFNDVGELTAHRAY